MFQWGNFWRPRPELNRGTRICSPLRHHSATRPHRLELSSGGGRLELFEEKRKGFPIASASFSPLSFPALRLSIGSPAIYYMLAAVAGVVSGTPWPRSLLANLTARMLRTEASMTAKMMRMTIVLKGHRRLCAKSAAPGNAEKLISRPAASPAGCCVAENGLPTISQRRVS